MATAKTLRRENIDKLSWELDGLSLDDASPGAAQTLDRLLSEWVDESEKFYQAEKAREEQESRVQARPVAKVPTTDQEWADLAVKRFGHATVAHRDAEPTGEKLYAWLNRCEECMITGLRAVDWIDPLLDEQCRARGFRDDVLFPVGCGYGRSVAIVPAMRDAYTFHVADLTDVVSSRDPAKKPFSNQRERDFKLGQAGDKGRLRQKMQYPDLISYRETDSGTFPLPATVKVHGDRVSCLWHDRFADPPCHLLKIYKLPRLSADPGDATLLHLPDHFSRQFHYEILWPYMVFACDSKQLFEIEWLWRFRQADRFRSIKDEPSADFLVVVDLETSTILRAWESPGRVNHVSVYPSQIHPDERAVPGSEYRVFWGIDQNSDEKLHRVTFDDHLLAPGMMLRAYQMWKSDEVARLKQPEIPRMIRRFPDGHLVQISDHNASMLIESTSDEIYPEGRQFHFSRDTQCTDCSVTGNVCVTLLADQTVSFACIRAADSRDAMRSITQWRRSELRECGEHADKTYQGVLCRSYKAVCQSVERVAVQFDDCTLVVFRVLSPLELERLRVATSVARSEHEMKPKLAAMVEQKVAEAVQEAKKARGAETTSDVMEQ